MNTLALAAVLSLLGGAAPPPEPSRPARFLALGDSYTIGEGLVPAEPWPVQLVARLRERGVAVGEPVIIARTGWTVADLADAVAAARPQGSFDLVTLQIGVNDQYQGADPGRYRPAFAALLRRAVALAGGRPERVVVLSIPDWSVTPFAGETGRERPLLYWFQISFGLLATVPMVARRLVKTEMERGPRRTRWKKTCEAFFFAFLTMLLVWKEGTPYWEVAIAYALIGIGVGFAGTPASHSLTSAVPVQRAGMASGTADLQRDLGGAVMQSIFGALLTAGFTSNVRV